MCFRRRAFQAIASLHFPLSSSPCISRFAPPLNICPSISTTISIALQNLCAATAALYGRSLNGTRTINSSSSSSSPSVRFPKLFSSLKSNHGSSQKIQADEQHYDHSNACSIVEKNDFHEDDEESDDAKEPGEVLLPVTDENQIQDIETILGFLRDFGSNAAEAKSRLEQCEITPSSLLVINVLSRVRNDWSAAFTFFLWAGKHPHYSHSTREYHAMISILGKMRKFDTAWSLIEEMKGGRTPQMVTPQTLLIMIRKYCAAHDVGKAINIFYAFKRFNFEAGIGEFQDLLSALCRYKNVEDAEHLLYCNEHVFPFETKSFNIILNGWSNIVGNLRQAKRFWISMSEKGIVKDVFSYSSMMACYSKAASLNDVLKLFNQMKQLGIVPDRKVYNAVTHALAKGKCVQEAIDLVKTMEEKGFPPNAVTYNSLIKPLCKARRLEDARAIFKEMVNKGLSPSLSTYHAFFSVVKDEEEIFHLLGEMKKQSGCQCHPTTDTYIMLVRKFCQWRQHENAFKLWNEMAENGYGHDRSSYIVLTHGLFFSGKCEEAFKYYEEMKAKGFSPEPRTDEMLMAWASGKDISRPQMLDLKGNELEHGSVGRKSRGDCNSYNRLDNHTSQTS